MTASGSGGYVEEAVVASVKVVVERDSETALDLISNHRNLRRKCRSIEAEILVLLVTQQPVAGDLRTLASTLEVALELERIGDHAKEIAGIGLKLEPGGAVKSMTVIATQQPVAGDMRILAAILEIVTELERIGDYAKGIANINLMMGDAPLIKPLVDIPAMADHARDMLHQALHAFTERDVDLAREIAAKDDVLDNLYNQVYRELLTLIMSNPKNIGQATYLTWAAHNLERTGDRVLNICERVIFMVTGEMIELNREG